MRTPARNRWRQDEDSFTGESYAFICQGCSACCSPPSVSLCFRASFTGKTGKRRFYHLPNLTGEIMPFIFAESPQVNTRYRSDKSRSAKRQRFAFTPGKRGVFTWGKTGFTLIELLVV
ncbi:MAG: prepilin-type N-terminal cleavage/methylation domain-containing protein, partial [Pedobacter sp.]